MEYEPALKLVDRILKFLSKIKCKMLCCCKSSCSVEPENTLEI